MEDAKRWAEKYQSRVSIVKIAEEEGVDPGTVGSWLHKLGLEIRQGQHFVPQPPLKLPSPLVSLVSQGRNRVAGFLSERVWGLRASDDGLDRLGKFCQFVKLYNAQCGVQRIANDVELHRSTVTKWRNGTDLPYLIRASKDTLGITLDPGWKALPLRIDSGGNEPKDWVVVPTRIGAYEDIRKVFSQLRILESAYERASGFGISKPRVLELRGELFAYLLGVMLGDASKLGGEQTRFTSMNLNLQLTMKRESNERLGEFVCLCASILGIRMKRIADKNPTGTTSLGRHPSAAYRWTSDRSPLLAWMFSVCLGLTEVQATSKDAVSMEWIFNTPFPFRKRFVQGMSDSDATVKKYVVEITSVPNADFVKRLLWSLGLKSAYVRIEKGIPLRTVVRATEAANIPLVNEFTSGYRHEQLMRYKRSD